MVKLSVNLNKVALLRNSRRLDIPDLLRATKVCIYSGADGITIHPRPDERHIRFQDVFVLADLIQKINSPLSLMDGNLDTKTIFVPNKEIEYNIEGNPFIEPYMELIRKVQPHQCTLVPDTLTQSTSDHGWEKKEDFEKLKKVIKELKKIKLRISLFMDPKIENIKRVQDLDIDRIELYTEDYARAFGTSEKEKVIEKYIEASLFAQSLGLGINAGHDLNLQNLGFFLKKIPGLIEVSIGHAFISDALFWGLEKTTSQYLEICRRPISNV